MPLKSVLLLEPFNTPELKENEKEGEHIRKALLAYINWLLHKKFKSTINGVYSIPLGLAEISMIVKKEGVETIHIPFILDALKHTISDQEIEKKIRSFDFDEVWMSCGSTETAFETIRYAKIVKRINKDTPVMVGGMVPSFSPEFFLNQPEIDVLLRGVADLAIKQYIKDLSKENLKHIQGFCYKKNGELYISPKFAIEPDINTMLPFDLEGMCIDEYMKVNPYCNIQYSKGCPFNCPFCAHTSFYGLKVRYRPIENIKKELKVLEEHGCEGGYIIDSTFTLNKNKLVDFAKAYKEIGCSMKLWFETRADKFSNDIAQICKQFNSILVWFGAESGSPEVLKNLRGKAASMGKEHVNNLFKAVKVAKNNDLLSGGSWVIGLPGESKDTIKETENVIFNLFKEGMDISDVRILQIFPGTDYWNNPEKWGLKLSTKDITSLSSPWDYYAAHETKNMTSKEIVNAAYNLKKNILEYYLKKINNYKSENKR